MKSLTGPRLITLACTLCSSLIFSSCSSQTKAEGQHLSHNFVYGKTAYVGPDGKAQAPPSAPKAVHKMVAAANELVGKPYKYGGGHRSWNDSGYDCSGSISYILHKGGKLDKPLVSQQFFDYGKQGYGDYVTLYMRDGHVFMEICGLRFDTGGTWNSTGPRWKPQRRGLKGYYVRHPRGI